MQVRRRTLADFAGLATWIAISLMLAFLAYSLGGVDFGVYYAAARTVLQGGNPYDYQQLYDQIVLAAGKSNNPFYYAPWFLWALLPIAALPFAVARVVWALINLILWMAGLLTLGRVLEWPSPGWRRWIMFTLAAAVFAFSSWGFEQVGVLILFLLALALWLEQEERWTALGLVLTMLMFKPNVTVLPVAAMCAWLGLRGRWRPLITAAVSLVFLLAASVVLMPGWYVSLAQPDKATGLSYTLGAQGVGQIQRYNTTMLDWLAAYGITGGVARGAYAVAAVAGVLLVLGAIRRAAAFVEVASVAILAGLAITPYALFYDYPMLVVPIFWSSAQLGGSPRLRRIRLLLNVALVTCLGIGRTISYRYWMIPVVAILLAFAWPMRQRDLKVAPTHPDGDARATAA